MEFGDWMNEVDRVIQRRIGFTSWDLPDQTWNDWFTDGIEADEAAALALENEGLAR